MFCLREFQVKYKLWYFEIHFLRTDLNYSRYKKGDCKISGYSHNKVDNLFSAVWGGLFNAPCRLPTQHQREISLRFLPLQDDKCKISTKLERCSAYPWILTPMRKSRNILRTSKTPLKIKTRNNYL